MAKSTIMMAFFLTMPMSRMIPRNEYRFRSWPKSSNVRRAPIAAAGRPERIVMGWIKLS